MDENETQDNAYLKKRLELCKKENEILKKENTVIQSELNGLKGTITEIVEGKQRPQTATGSGDNENQLRCVLDFQRNRIEALEIELDSLNLQYQRLLFSKSDSGKEENYIAQSTRLLNSFSGTNQEVTQLKKQIEEGDMKIQQLTQQYSKEIASLKNKAAQQDAEIILFSQNQGGGNPYSSMGSFNNNPLNRHLSTNSVSQNSASYSSGSGNFPTSNLNSYNALKSQLNLSTQPSLQPIQSQQSISAASINYNHLNNTRNINPYENSFQRENNSSSSTSTQNNDIQYYNYSNNTLFKY